VSIYTDVDRIYAVEPMIGSLSAISSADLGVFISDAEAEVNAAIVRSYTVPVASSTPLIRAITTDIAIYRVLSRRVFTQERLKDSTWPDRFKESNDLLEKIATGDLLLVSISGDILTTRGDIAELTSTTKDFHPTFSELSFDDAVQDQDKLDELASKRNIGIKDRLT